jgi:hypothetical protein
MLSGPRPQLLPNINIRQAPADIMEAAAILIMNSETASNGMILDKIKATQNTITE